MLFAGGKRFSHLLYLGENKDLLAGLFGVERLPKASSTLTRFFGNIKTWKAIESFHEKLWPFLLNVISWDKIKEDDLTFDSHVAVRFGKQVGATIGYNIKKPGRPSHHPLIGFLNQSRFVVNLWNRPGNASSAHNILAFLNQTLLRLRNRLNIRTVFADSGFYELPFLQSLEEQKTPYVVAVKLHQVIQKVFFLKTLLWNEVAPGIEMIAPTSQTVIWISKYYGTGIVSGRMMRIGLKN